MSPLNLRFYLPDDEDLDMPLLPQKMQNVVAFVYGSNADAQRDKNFQATATILAVASTTPMAGNHYYAVTNKHVVDDLGATLCLRFNKRGGGVSLRTFRREEWETNSKHDIAAAPIVFGEEEFSYIHEPMILTTKRRDAHKIGPADDVFLVSRYPRKGGTYKQSNHPLIRWGNIAMMPTTQEPYFTAEVRSVGGHSGSPVFVVDLPFSFPETRWPHEKFYCYFLGVDLGHVVDYEPIIRYDRTLRTAVEHQDWRAPSNVALTQVTPAWKVWQLVNHPRFRQSRLEWDENWKNHGWTLPDFQPDEGQRAIPFAAISPDATKPPRQTKKARLVGSPTN